MKNEYKFIKLLLKLAKKAYKKGDVPVSAIIVKDNKIISRAFNKKEKNKNAIDHAEVIAIKKACKKLKTWHLDDCILYTTMEPCMMCSGAIYQSRIKNIIYFVENEKFGFIINNNQFNNSKYNIKKIENDEYLNIVKKFFNSKR